VTIIKYCTDTLRKERGEKNFERKKKHIFEYTYLLGGFSEYHTALQKAEQLQNTLYFHKIKKNIEKSIFTSSSNKRKEIVLKYIIKIHIAHTQKSFTFIISKSKQNFSTKIKEKEKKRKEKNEKKHVLYGITHGCKSINKKTSMN